MAGRRKNTNIFLLWRKKGSHGGKECNYHPVITPRECHLAGDVNLPRLPFSCTSGIEVSSYTGYYEKGKEEEEFLIRTACNSLLLQLTLHLCLAAVTWNPRPGLHPGLCDSFRTCGTRTPDWGLGSVLRTGGGDSKTLFLSAA